jgi:plasmid stability protein
MHRAGVTARGGMAQVTLGDLDETLLIAISRRAAQNGRPVEEEIVCLVRLGLSARADRDRLVIVADAIAGLTPPGPQTDPVELLREERSR